jgi:hypothetical protein
MAKANDPERDAIIRTQDATIRKSRRPRDHGGSAAQKSPSIDFLLQTLHVPTSNLS